MHDVEEPFDDFDRIGIEVAAKWQIWMVENPSLGDLPSSDLPSSSYALMKSLISESALYETLACPLFGLMATALQAPADLEKLLQVETANLEIRLKSAISPAANL